MKYFNFWRAALAVLATASVCLSEAAVASAGGDNSANAALCQKGGWQNVFRSDSSRFANQGDCVSYAAHGGTLIQNKGQLDCGSFGGTYAAGTAPTLWTCTGFTATANDDYANKVLVLIGDCVASGGNAENFSVLSPFPTTNTSFSCFVA